VHRIVFAHGMESSPEGRKARYLREELGAIAPRLGHLGPEDQVGALRLAVGDRAPAVVVGSSLGGLAALGLAASHPGLVAHLVLLAPAVGMHRRAAFHPDVEARRPGLFSEAERLSGLSIPAEVPAAVIHGLEDSSIDAPDVIDLVRRSPSAALILVHDDHALTGSRSLILEVVSRAARGLDPLAGRAL